MKLAIKLARFWLFLAAAAFCGYMAMFNKETMTLTFPPWIEHLAVSTYVGMSMAFLTGVTITLIFFGGEIIGRQWHLKRLRKELRELKSQEERFSKSPTKSNSHFSKELESITPRG
jgi:uncharacterized integral membrane protein